MKNTSAPRSAHELCGDLLVVAVECLRILYDPAPLIHDFDVGIASLELADRIIHDHIVPARVDMETVIHLFHLAAAPGQCSRSHKNARQHLFFHLIPHQRPPHSGSASDRPGAARYMRPLF